MKTQLISTGIHVAVVGLCLMPRTVHIVSPKPDRPPTMIYVPDIVEHHPRFPGASGPQGTRIATIAVPTTVPPNIPPIDVHNSGPPIATEDTTWTTGPSQTHAGGNGTGDGPTNGVHTADVVDVQVTPYAGAPAPRYPESLRAAGVEGEVTLEFVVDTTGRLERGSVRRISSTAQAFVVSVSEALAATRYHPALVDGRHVRQLVRQQFVFSLTQR